MHAKVHPLERRFEEFVQAGPLVRNGDTVLVAVSGGVDSMALLHLFLSLKDCMELHFHVAHVNHQLRGAESMQDEKFVRDLARSRSLPFHGTRTDTTGYAHRSKLSKQEAARELRYRFFEQLRQELGAGVVATAHQADDNAETVLLNALRGTGIRGLSGIPVQRNDGAIIRPLLFARRSDIEEYARFKQITFRHDSSNDSLDYKRNYLRKTVLPLLQSEIHPDIVGSLNRVSTVMRQLDDRITREVAERWPSLVSKDRSGTTNIRISNLLSEPTFLQEEVIVRLLRSLQVEVQAEKVLLVLGLCSHPTGRSLQLSHDIVVYRDRNALVFMRQPIAVDLDQTVEIGHSYAFPSFRFAVSTEGPLPAEMGGGGGNELVDAARLGSRLRIRTWRRGDWFMPLGMKTRKKLSDFFTDEKVPRFEKERIPILESDDTIVWICGRRLDDRFKVTPSTRSVVRLEYSPTIPA